MIKKSVLLAGMMIGLLLFVTGCGPQGNASAEFWVRGNCEMCQDNIETALEDLEGVASASYDLESNLLSVSFDSNAVSVPAMHKACAKAGYDTKVETASDEDHDQLPMCCRRKEAI
jgi:mercuric ion binding protein